MILAILQARMSSSRLPGKVLRDLLGKPMMVRQIERIRRARRIDRLIVATSDDASDDPVAETCAREGVTAFRGSLGDVLSRFCGAEATHGPADHVVRLTADCPVTDWRVIDACIEAHLDGGYDYTANAIEPTFPDGLDVEVMKAPILRLVGREAQSQHEREHVTPFIYRNPERFRLHNVRHSSNLSHLRWTVDTLRDFELIEIFYRELYPGKPDFSEKDIVALIQKRPELAAFNVDQAGPPKAVS